MVSGQLAISDTKVELCQVGSTDSRCADVEAQLNAESERLDNLSDIDLGIEDVVKNTTNTTAALAEVSPKPSNNDTTTTTGGTLDTNGYIIGGLVGATGLVATTLLIIFRAPKSVRSGLDDGPDLETVTEQNFPDDGDFPEVSEDLMFEQGTNATEAGPAAADIEAVFPSIFSNILGDLGKD